MIQNPVLRGFNPDPSILRVGEDYYVATSSFEWYPGVPIYHSRDLAHWRLLTYAVTHQVDLRGNPDSGGIWAPCLSHDGERFHLIFTDVKSWSEVGYFKDSHNYLTTAEHILGPWSAPIHLNSSGFDPSFFHEGGRKWCLNALWDHRQGKNKFGGILLQEYDPGQGKLVGEVHNIFKGTALRVTEAPHLYKHDGWYYLMTAEGGTAYAHAVTMARSRSILGPYEVDPHNPILTAAGRPELLLQKAGHASLVQTQTDEWYIAHLCGRPLDPPDFVGTRRCNLGRETALQQVEWRDGWLRLVDGGNTPREAVNAPNLRPHPWSVEPERDDFEASQLGLYWNTLRIQADESWLSLRERPGFLRLYGRESLSSKHRQSLVARRLQSHRAVVTTCLDFNPKHFQQMAGLVLFYDTQNYIYLHLSANEGGRYLGLITCAGNRHNEPAGEFPLPAEGEVHLRARFDVAELRLSYSLEGADWLELPLTLDVGKLSDEEGHLLGFTGTFVGLCVQDLAGTRLHADFDYFEYKEFAG